jgi:hypothetical protein
MRRANADHSVVAVLPVRYGYIFGLLTMTHSAMELANGFHINIAAFTRERLVPMIRCTYDNRIDRFIVDPAVSFTSGRLPVSLAISAPFSILFRRCRTWQCMLHRAFSNDLQVVKTHTPASDQSDSHESPAEFVSAFRMKTGAITPSGRIEPGVSGTCVELSINDVLSINITVQRKKRPHYPVCRPTAGHAD